MELLGEILHFSKSGRLIVKLDRFDSSMKTGQNISNDQGKMIGKITEFIGPITSPYASIIPFIQKKNKLTDTICSQKFTGDRETFPSQTNLLMQFIKNRIPMIWNEDCFNIRSNLINP